MSVSLDGLRPRDLVPLQLSLAFEADGYQKYRMSRFEEYSLYRKNQGFLASNQIISFTDLDGRLMALKPDVTLSIVKNAQPATGECSKYYYSETVYRPSEQSHTFREISQMGLECIGAVDSAATAQVVSLALDSLQAAGGTHLLTISHMGFVTGLLDGADLPIDLRSALLDCVRDKKNHELVRLCETGGAGLALANDLCALIALSGKPETVLAQVKTLVRGSAMHEALHELEALVSALGEKASTIRLDLSLVNDINYYNGLVLRGYLSGVPRPVLQGGRYDPLAAQFSPGAKAIGFALYLDDLFSAEPAAAAEQGEMLSIALPKGRLGEKVYRLLAESGYGCEEDFSQTRKLIVENQTVGVRYLWAKPSDVAIYVEHGAVDIGIVGKDILDEAHADVYELLDTGLGKCRMCVAAPNDFCDDPSRTLRVATKFPEIAKRFYAGQGRDIDIIKLNGSIEVAPLVGLSDVIVDIVETGTTLKENNLSVVQEFLPISARLIAGKASYQFKRKKIDALCEKLQEVTGK